MGRRPEPGPGGVTRAASIALMAQRGIGYKAAATYYAELHGLSDVDARKLTEKIKRWAKWGRENGHLEAAGSSSSRATATRRASASSAGGGRATRPSSSAAARGAPPNNTPPPAQEEEVEPPAPPPLVDVSKLDRLEMARWTIRQWVWAIEDARFRGHSQAAQRALLQLQNARRELEAAEAEAEAARPKHTGDKTPAEMRAALEELAARLEIVDLEVFVREYLTRTGATLTGGDVWF